MRISFQLLLHFCVFLVYFGTLFINSTFVYKNYFTQKIHNNSTLEKIVNKNPTMFNVVSISLWLFFLVYAIQIIWLLQNFIAIICKLNTNVPTYVLIFQTLSYMAHICWTIVIAREKYILAFLFSIFELIFVFFSILKIIFTLKYQELIVCFNFIYI